MSLEYKPFRIMKPFAVTARSPQDMATRYPNAANVKKLGKYTYEAQYRLLAVVNIPSESELVLFSNKILKVAREIPQDPRGFDVRDSGIARSVKSSLEARKDAGLVIARRKFALKEAEKKVVKEPAKPEQVEISEEVAEKLDSIKVPEVEEEESVEKEPEAPVPKKPRRYRPKATSKKEASASHKTDITEDDKDV